MAWMVQKLLMICYTMLELLWLDGGMMQMYPSVQLNLLSINRC
uniref:Uncharacterized protein n=1 Tax=Arundo donax TaxID=35708 RepID=A0A0A9HKD9_ARUDO